jgi:hypothetical protein
VAERDVAPVWAGERHDEEKGRREGEVKKGRLVGEGRISGLFFKIVTCMVEVFERTAGHWKDWERARG